MTVDWQGVISRLEEAVERDRREQLAATMCMGKAAFQSPGQALASIRRSRDGAVRPYCCEICGRWHIGRPPTPRPKMGYLRLKKRDH